MRVQGTHQIRSLVKMVKPKERGSSFLTTATGNPRGAENLAEQFHQHYRPAAQRVDGTAEYPTL